MTENTSIKRQLEALQKATERAIQTKASALRFLHDAGISSHGKNTKTGVVPQPKHQK